MWRTIVLRNGNGSARETVLLLSAALHRSTVHSDSDFAAASVGREALVNILRARKGWKRFLLAGLAEGIPSTVWQARCSTVLGDEEQCSLPRDLADRRERESLESGWNALPFSRGHREEQFVVVAAVQRQFQ